MRKYIKIILVIIFSSFYLSGLSDKKLMAEDKKDILSYLDRAQEFAQKGDDKEALIYYSKALGFKSSNAQKRLIWSRIGNIYETRKKYEKAIIAYKEVISLKKKNWEGYFNLGRIYQIVGLDDLAISSYEKVIKIKPEIFQVWFNLGKIYQRKKLYSDALKYYKKAQTINKSNIEICLELVSIYEKLGELDIASSYLEDVITLYPREEFFNKLGTLYLSQNKLDRSRVIFQKILDKNHLSCEVRLNLGYIYFKQGLINKSIREFNLVLDIDSGNVLARFLRGLVYYKEGKDDLAKRDCLFVYTNAKGKMLKTYARKMLNELSKVRKKS